MLKFFKKDRPSTDQETVNAEQVLSGQLKNSDASKNIHIDTKLSPHPSWNISEEEMYVYQFRNYELPPLKPNQLSLAPIEMSKYDDQITVSAFVRNSLEKKITFNETTLLLLSEKGQKLAKKKFDLNVLGEVPGQSSRPWGFIFDSHDLTVPIEELSTTNWQLAFEFRPDMEKHSLDLHDSWKKTMANEDIQQLKEYTEKLEPPKAGEINLFGLKAIQTEAMDLHVTMLIRNGNDREMQLQQLPLRVEDAAGDIIAEGLFKLDDFALKSNTSKPWTFTFPATMIQKDKADLSSWKAYPIQGK